MTRRRRKRRLLIGQIFGFFVRLLLFGLIIWFGLKVAAHYGIIGQDALQEVSETVTETVSEHVSLPGLPSAKPEVQWDVSQEGYYYAFLNETEQKLYQTLLHACENYEFQVELNEKADADMLFHAVTALTCDYPEYYWTNKPYTYYQNGAGKVVSVEFASDGSEESVLAAVERIADEVIAGCPEPGYEAYKYLYDWIIDTADYDETASESGQNLASVFLDHRSVCAGYSKAYQYLCKKAGMECIYVTGTAVMKDGTEGSHAWNLIRINGQYYWADVTWGDPVFEGNGSFGTNYNYFCVSDRTLNAEHTVSRELTGTEGSSPLFADYPSCGDDSYDWYVLNGSRFETYDPYAAEQYILQAQSIGRNRFEMKFGSLDELMNAKGDLINNEQFFRILQSAGVPCTTISYVLFEPIGAIWIIPQ